MHFASFSDWKDENLWLSRRQIASSPVKRQRLRSLGAITWRFTPIHPSGAIREPSLENRPDPSLAGGWCLHSRTILAQGEWIARRYLEADPAAAGPGRDGLSSANRGR